MPENLFDLTGDVARRHRRHRCARRGHRRRPRRAGARVAVLGRNQERGDACVTRITDGGGTATFFHADATQPASLAAAHKDIEAALGPPTVLVNAAGGNDPKITVTPDNPFEKIAADAWRASFEINLVGGILLPCQEFGPAMAERGKGSIINIASVSAHIPLSRVMAYSASKAAVLSLTQFLAREWAPKRRAGQHDHARLLPGRAEPRAALQPGRHRRRRARSRFSATRRWPGSASRKSWSAPPSSSPATPPAASSPAPTSGSTAGSCRKRSDSRGQSAMNLPKYSMGIGDRFAHQGEAQLAAFVKAKQLGVDVTPVWNKSNREHLIVHSEPAERPRRGRRRGRRRSVGTGRTSSTPTTSA